MNRREFIKKTAIGIGALTVPLTASCNEMVTEASTGEGISLPSNMDAWIGKRWDAIEYQRLMNRRAKKLAINTITARPVYQI